MPVALIGSVNVLIRAVEYGAYRLLCRIRWRNEPCSTPTSWAAMRPCSRLAWAGELHVMACSAPLAEPCAGKQLVILLFFFSCPKMARLLPCHSFRNPGFLAVPWVLCYISCYLAARLSSISQLGLVAAGHLLAACGCWMTPSARAPARCLLASLPPSPQAARPGCLPRLQTTRRR